MALAGTVVDSDTTDGLAPAERLLLRLDKYRQTGKDKWMACCPAHEDKTPSLSISEASDGKLLIHCFAGCEPTDVLEAVGLSFRELFPDDPDWTPRRATNGSTPSQDVDDALFVLDILSATVDAGQALTDSGRAQCEAAVLTLTRAGVDVPRNPAAKMAREEAREPVRGLIWIPDAEWIREMRAPDWLIPEHLERGTLNVNVGGWGSGKSVAELDRQLRIAHGMLWQGRQCTQSLTVYVVGEAQRGFQRRIAAWHQHHGIEPNGQMVVIPEAVLLGQPDANKAMAQALDEIQQRYGEAVSHVVLDTMARCFGLNDESSNSDVGRWVNSIYTYITEPTGAATTALHHPGHGAKDRGRGASALPGAADTEWLIEREGNGVVMRCNKSKDSEFPAPVAWRILGHSMEIDGQPVTAPVVEETEAPSDMEVSLKPGSRQSQAVDILVAMYREAKANLEAAGRGSHQAVIERQQWRERLEANDLISGANPRQAFNRLVDELVKKGAVISDPPHVYPGRPLLDTPF